MRLKLPEKQLFKLNPAPMDDHNPNFATLTSSES